MLAARNLHKAYVMGGRNLEVLRGIDLTVQRGEFRGLARRFRRGQKHAAPFVGRPGFAQPGRNSF